MAIQCRTMFLPKFRSILIDINRFGNGKVEDIRWIDIVNRDFIRLLYDPVISIFREKLDI